MFCLTKAKIRKRMAILLMGLVCWWMCAAGAAPLDDAQVASAPLTSRSVAMNGMVRVYLSSLGSPTTLHLTIRGSYSFDGEFLSSGSTVKVGFDASTGQISLTYDGKTINAGKEAALRRHNAAGSNGVLIAESRNSQNPYPGDISFQAVSSGSGYKLYTIAHVYIENYLYGVLPYEMGNSSSLEALKAQAVAARTYTVRMMKLRASGRYDVVDTTSDQVYRGTPAGNANCVAAVDATKGIVLMDGSGYITTYYSASNGGQTETARSGSSYSYMKVKDDPFDYANPSSTVKKKTVSADLTSASNPSALISLLKQKTVAKLSAQGYAATSGNTTLQTLKGVTPHTPMYASPSRLYTKMDFTLTANTQNSAGQSVTVTQTVTCDIFNELEGPLSMGIQSLDNELWSVTKNSGSFTLEARRYGHGMGMSQRGAMYMGKQGYTYDEILGFYYDGCQRVRHSFTNTILSASSTDVETTVETPVELEEGSGESACKATVTLAVSGASLAIRATKSTTGVVVGSAMDGAVVEVLSEQDGWCLIRFGEICGYAPASALSVSGTPPQEEAEVTEVLGFVTVTANDFVNLRSEGSMSGKVLGTAPTGAVLTVLAKNGSWAKVQYNTLAAYVNLNYVSAISAGYPSAQLSNGTAAARVTADGTMLRQTSSTSAQSLTELMAGTLVTVLSDDGSWAQIRVESLTGYVLSESLTYTEEETPQVDEPQKEENAVQGVTAIVTTAYGSLNMRAEARAGSRILTTIPRMAAVTVTQRGDEWCDVFYAGMAGYVMTSFLSFENDEDQHAESAGGEMLATVATPSGSLNLREQPRTGSRILTRVPPYAQVQVHQHGADWCHVSYQEYTGYVMTVFLSFDGPEETPAPEPTSQPETQPGEGDEEPVSTPDATEEPTPEPTLEPTPGPTPEPVEQPATAWVNTASGSLNLRQQPDGGSRVLTTIPRGASISVLAYGDEWCAVRYRDTEGYVMTRFLRFETQPVPAPNEPTEEAPVPIPAEEMESSQGTAAWVSTDSGSLNLRETPTRKGQVLTEIPRHAKVELLEKGTEWSHVRYGDITGFAMTRYLTLNEPVHESANEDKPKATEDPIVVSGALKLDLTLEAPDDALYAVNGSDGSLRLWPMCEKSGEPIASVPEGEMVEVILKGQTWCCVDFGGVQGYCLTSELDGV